MPTDYMSFMYVDQNGTEMSEEDFYSEHKDVILNPLQKERLKQNLEIQCILVLRELGDSEKLAIKSEFVAGFLFEDSETKEFYLRPLYEIDLRVFLRKLACPLLLVYDVKMVS